MFEQFAAKYIVSFQVANYAQTLWGPIQNEGQFIGNGFVECSNTLLCNFHLNLLNARFAFQPRF